MLATPNSFEMLYIGIIAGNIMLSMMCAVSRGAHAESP